jgi:hypothetical protein
MERLWSVAVATGGSAPFGAGLDGASHRRAREARLRRSSRSRFAASALPLAVSIEFGRMPCPRRRPDALLSATGSVAEDAHVGLTRSLPYVQRSSSAR